MGSPIPFGVLTITLVRRIQSGEDAYGQDTWTEQQIAVSGCAVQPVSTNEQLGNVDRVLSRWKLFAPGDTVIEPTDKVVLDGQPYEVDGAAQVWPDINGQPHHVEVYLREVLG
jgi:hypothetical protein